jgi:hypothetical protein
LRLYIRKACTDGKIVLKELRKAKEDKEFDPSFAEGLEAH